MRVRVRVMGVETDGAACPWIERRLHDVFGPLGRSVLRIVVRVEGSDRSRGGRAACSVEVRLRPAGRVMVFETGRDVREATERALDCAASAVSECLRHTKGMLGGAAPAALHRA
jgi:hypothetical protein